MVELRKRKDPPPAPAPATKRKSTGRASKAAAAIKEKVTGKKDKDAAAVSNGAAPEKAAKSGPPTVGDTIDIDGFGGEVETNDGEKTTLKKLVDDSDAGVVIFTYPKASTPGCTNQACLFRDSYEPLTATGLKIYGLSTDSPKSNTNFKTKQSLQYPLLCDSSANLIKPLGFKKTPSGTKRGVFVVAKDGKVLVREEGGPAATVEAVKKAVNSMGGKGDEVGAELEKKQTEDEEKADVAGEVADSAAKIDGEGS